MKTKRTYLRSIVISLLLYYPIFIVIFYLLSLTMSLIFDGSIMVEVYLSWVFFSYILKKSSVGVVVMTVVNLCRLREDINKYRRLR